MEYAQERITTLHHLTTDPIGFDGLEGPLERTAVVVPMTHHEHGSDAATGVFAALETIDPAPARVVVAVRADAERIDDVRRWLEGFDLPIRVLWCTAPSVVRLLDRHGLEDGLGKGRDVWLALGVATDSPDVEYVVVHDADAQSFSADHVARLLQPLAPAVRDDPADGRATSPRAYTFVKGYYARVEAGRLYGRLNRLFYEPLVRAVSTHSESDPPEPIVHYLESFRYALAGEFAMTAELARRLRPPRTWGLEVATLGDAFAHAGFEGTAQVDLGVHRHDHRTVDGDAGLEGMSREVAASLLRVLEEGGVDLEYDRLREQYRSTAQALIEQYRSDAICNDLTYDVENEREQVDRYAQSLESPRDDRRLPPWSRAPLDGADVQRAATPWMPDPKPSDRQR